MYIIKIPQTCQDLENYMLALPTYVNLKTVNNIQALVRFNNQTLQYPHGYKQEVSTQAQNIYNIDKIFQEFIGKSESYGGEDCDSHTISSTITFYNLTNNEIEIIKKAENTLNNLFCNKPILMSNKFFNILNSASITYSKIDENISSDLMKSKHRKIIGKAEKEFNVKSIFNFKKKKKDSIFYETSVFYSPKLNHLILKLNNELSSNKLTKNNKTINKLKTLINYHLKKYK